MRVSDRATSYIICVSGSLIWSRLVTSTSICQDYRACCRRQAFQLQNRKSGCSSNIVCAMRQVSNQGRMSDDIGWKYWASHKFEYAYFYRKAHRIHTLRSSLSVNNSTAASSNIPPSSIYWALMSNAQVDARVNYHRMFYRHHVIQCLGGSSSNGSPSAPSSTYSIMTSHYSHSDACVHS